MRIQSTAAVQCSRALRNSALQNLDGLIHPAQCTVDNFVAGLAMPFETMHENVKQCWHANNINNRRQGRRRNILFVSVAFALDCVRSFEPPARFPQVVARIKLQQRARYNREYQVEEKQGRAGGLPQTRQDDAVV